MHRCMIDLWQIFLYRPYYLICYLKFPAIPRWPWLSNRQPIRNGSIGLFGWWGPILKNVYLPMYIYHLTILKRCVKDEKVIRVLFWRNRKIIIPSYLFLIMITSRCIWYTWSSHNYQRSLLGNLPKMPLPPPPLLVYRIQCENNVTRVLVVSFISLLVIWNCFH